jgi:hypothetical protein
VERDQSGEEPDQGGEEPDQGGEEPDQGGKEPDQGSRGSRSCLERIETLQALCYPAATQR